MGDMMLEQKARVLEVLLEETEEWREGRLATDDELEDDEDGVRSYDVDEDAMEISEGAAPPPSARKLPPVGNFALSPARRSSPAAGQSSRTPGVLSPSR